MRCFALCRLFIPLSLVAHAGAQIPAPTGLEASNGAYSTKVGLSWEHVQGATAYRILRAPSNDSAAAATVGTTPSIIFYDKTAQPQVEYHYWVQAVAGDANSAYSAPATGFRALGITSAFGRIEPLDPPPAPVDNPVTGAKVYLGKTLFWDEQLSSTRTMACGSCHFPRQGGGDPRPGQSPRRHPGPNGRFGDDDDIIGSVGVPRNRADGSYLWSEAFGVAEQVTDRKANSMIDAAYADVGLFWDGRAEREFLDPATGEPVYQNGVPLESQALENQALEPLLSTVEMGHDGRTLDEVVARVQSIEPLALSPSIPGALAAWIGGRSYADLFAEAFGDPEITAIRIAMAIASYERTLYSDRTQLDRLVSAIEEWPADVSRGHDLFFDNFCDECHRGGLLGDNRFHYIGVRPQREDVGRSKVSGSGLDLGRMRTPSLRNVMLRAPYMHNGRFASIEEALEFYNRGGDFDGTNKDNNFVRPMNLTDQDRADFFAFFRAATDPRVAAGAAPLFDRPTLFTESARAPEIIGSGVPSAGATPQVIALEPPLLGNSNFTVGLADATPGVQATLVIHESDPGLGPSVPSNASFYRGAVTTEPEGYASVTLAIPNDAALAGRTLYGRWYVRSGTATAVTPAFRMTLFAPPAPPADITAIAGVSAASLAPGFVSPESIVSGFGANFTDQTAQADTVPLPTTLGGVSITVTDSQGAERRAPLFYVSPSQINYQAPAGTAPGAAIVSVRGLAGVVATGTLQVAAVAPSLYSANADGQGVAAALILRIAPNGDRTIEQIADYDLAQGRYLPAPIAFNGDDLYLLLFGSGVRAAQPGDTAVTVGGELAPVLYAGAHPDLVGLDQINIQLPPSLAGRGEIEIQLTTAGKSANKLTLRVE